jgi:hypothetical protein
VCGGEIVYRFVVSGETAASAWRSIREHAQEGGFWPVILGPNDAINAHNNLLDVRHAADESLKRAETLDLDSWRQSRLEERREYVPDFQRPHAQSWPSIDDVAVQTEFTVPLATISHRPLKQIWIGLVPVRHSWEVPSFFRFGNWNEVPGPDVHVALHRRWHAEFGAELVSFKNDILEFQVARPPMTRDAALELAQWQYDYCPDIVEQGTQSIEALAISLLNGPIWYFWWD